MSRPQWVNIHSFCGFPTAYLVDMEKQNVYKILGGHQTYFVCDVIVLFIWHFQRLWVVLYNNTGIGQFVKSAYDSSNNCMHLSHIASLKTHNGSNVFLTWAKMSCNALYAYCAYAYKQDDILTGHIQHQSTALKDTYDTNHTLQSRSQSWTGSKKTYIITWPGLSWFQARSIDKPSSWMFSWGYWGYLKSIHQFVVPWKHTSQLRNSCCVKK